MLNYFIFCRFNDKLRIFPGREYAVQNTIIHCIQCSIMMARIDSQYYAVAGDEPWVRENICCIKAPAAWIDTVVLKHTFGVMKPIGRRGNSVISHVVGNSRVFQVGCDCFSLCVCVRVRLVFLQDLRHFTSPFELINTFAALQLSLWYYS